MKKQINTKTKTAINLNAQRRNSFYRKRIDALESTNAVLQAEININRQTLIETQLALGKARQDFTQAKAALNPEMKRVGELTLECSTLKNKVDKSRATLVSIAAEIEYECFDVEQWPKYASQVHEKARKALEYIAE